MQTIGARFRHFRLLFQLNQEDIGEKLGIPSSSISKIEAGKQEPSEPVIKLLEYSFQLNRKWLLKEDGDIFLRGKEKKVAGDEAHKFFLTNKEFRSPKETNNLVHESELAKNLEPPLGDSITGGRFGEYVYVPKYDVKASGGVGFIIHSEQVVDFLAFKKEWVQYALRVHPQQLALISAVGDSMESAINDGDLLLLDISKNKIGNDGIYCFKERNALKVKRFQMLFGGILKVISDNRSYDSYTVSGNDVDKIEVVGRVVWIGRLT